MKGIFIDKSAELCTKPSGLLAPLGDKICDYSWLLCDLTGWDSIFKRYEDLIVRTDGAVFLPGTALKKILDENRLATANWAVFSAFPPDTHLEEILKYPLPYSDFNKTLWFNPVKMLHPLSGIEVVISEITDISVKSDDEEILDLFRKSTGKIGDLEKHNDQFTPPISDPASAVRENTSEKKSLFSKLFGK
ncbi:MAG: hypothetical protein J5685_02020 [Clostridiales bacterium]|nr:hypothetical protein [Clostridiales bacterium]